MFLLPSVREQNIMRVEDLNKNAPKAVWPPGARRPVAGGLLLLPHLNGRWGFFTTHVLSAGSCV